MTAEDDQLKRPFYHLLTRRRLLGLAAGTAFLAACGGGDDDDGESTATGTAEGSPEATSSPQTTATTAATSESSTRTFTDSLGSELEIPAAPQRVVALHDYNVATIMLSLGFKPVGSVGRSGGLDVLATSYDVSGVEFLGQFGEPDMEAIVALQPDLIVGAVNAGQPGWIPDGSVEQLNQIAPTVFIDHMRFVDDVAADYADLLGVEQDFEKLQAAYEDRVAAIKDQYGEALSELTVGVVSFYYMEWGINTPVQPTIDGVLSDLGVTTLSLEADSPERENFISAERIREIDSDLLIILRYSDADPKPEEVPLYDQLAVAQMDQAFEVDGRAWIERSYQALDLILDSFETWLPEVDTSIV